MFSIDPNIVSHKEWNSLPPEVVEEVFWILTEEDAWREKNLQMKQHFFRQWRKSQQLCRIVKKYCWSDDDASSGNDV